MNKTRTPWLVYVLIIRKTCAIINGEHRPLPLRRTPMDQFAASVVGCTQSRALAVAPARGDCNPEWARGLFRSQATNGTACALAFFDGVEGSALYAGGSFTSAGNPTQ